MGLNADGVWLDWTVFLIHALFFFILPFSFSCILPLTVDTLTWVTLIRCDTRYICRTGNKNGLFLPLVTEPTAGFRLPLMRLRYLVEEPVDLHTHRLGEKLPAAVQLRLVQLLPGELELLVCKQQRHDGFHSLSSHSGQRQQRRPLSSTEDMRTQRFRLKPLENE